MTKDPRVKMWLAAMDFDASNAQRVFELIEGDDGDDKLSAEELVNGVAKLKGSAKSIDLLDLQRHFNKVERSVQRVERGLVDCGVISLLEKRPSRVSLTKRDDL